MLAGRSRWRMITLMPEKCSGKAFSTNFLLFGIEMALETSSSHLMYSVALSITLGVALCVRSNHTGKEPTYLSTLPMNWPPKFVLIWASLLAYSVFAVGGVLLGLSSLSSSSMETSDEHRG